MNQLTASQKHVIEHPYAPGTTLKVNAGPGSGKSFTLFAKVYALIQQKIVQPNEILVLSLTNQAVGSLNSGIANTFKALTGDLLQEEELSELIAQIKIYTFHALAHKVVTEHLGLINVIEDNGWRGLMHLVPAAFWKSRNIHSAPKPRDVERILREQIASGSPHPDTERVLEIMRSSNVVTNDEILFMAAKYLRKGMPQCLKTTDEIKNIKVVIVDEYQDLFPVLTPLLKAISQKKYLILFGDPNQSIYSFLGDNSRVMKELDAMRDDNHSAVLNLYDNFRSSPEIIRASMQILDPTKFEYIHNNTHMRPPSGVGPIKVDIEESEEVSYLLDQVCQLICSSAKFSDIAVLTSTNTQVQTLEKELTKYGIPVNKLVSQPDWMSDSRVVCLIDLLRAMKLITDESMLPPSAPPELKKSSNFSVIVTLSRLRGMGPSYINKLYNAANGSGVSLWESLLEAEKSKFTSIGAKAVLNKFTSVCKRFITEELYEIDTPDQLISKLMALGKDLGIPLLELNPGEDLESFDKNIGDLRKVLELCSSIQPSNTKFVDWVLKTYLEQTLMLHRKSSSTDQESIGAISLATMHAAKGLEFPIVFLMGRAQSFFQIQTNCLYVGMTRSRNLLYLVNIKHPKVDKLDSYSEEIVKNDKFWQYYNNDMRRHPARQSMSGVMNYNLLRAKFSFVNKPTRSYMTSALTMLKVGKCLLK